MSNKPIPKVTEVTKPYWDAAQREELYLQRSRSQGTYQFYPRPWSLADYTEEDIEWVKASGKGTVFTYTVVHHPLFESYADEAPYIIGVIQLKEGPRMMTNILNCKPEDLRVGMAVKVTFEERKDGFKVPQFEPA